MSSGPTYVIHSAGNWSGGGMAVLNNFRHAAMRHPRMGFEEGDVAVINRNVPTDRLRQPYVLIPQNAWPWEGPKFGVAERLKLVVMRVASERAMRGALGVIRVGGSIPVKGRAHRSLLPNPLDPDFEDAVTGLANSAPPQDSPYFACLGTMNSYRGLETLVEAYSAYRGDGGRTTLVIGGHAKEHYLRRVRRLAEGVEGSSLRSRPLPRRECLTTLRHARLALLPSHVEASPLSLLEALAVTRNVAASDIPGHRDIVPSGTEHPWYFRHAHPHGLTRLMHEADEMGGAPSVHPLATAERRESERARWGDDLVRILDELVTGNV